MEQQPAEGASRAGGELIGGSGERRRPARRVAQPEADLTGGLPALVRRRPSERGALVEPAARELGRENTLEDPGHAGAESERVEPPRVAPGSGDFRTTIGEVRSRSAQGGRSQSHVEPASRELALGALVAVVRPGQEGRAGPAGAEQVERGAAAPHVHARQVGELRAGQPEAQPPRGRAQQQGRRNRVQPGAREGVEAVGASPRNHGRAAAHPDVAGELAVERGGVRREGRAPAPPDDAGPEGQARPVSSPRRSEPALQHQYRHVGRGDRLLVHQRDQPHRCRAGGAARRDPDRHGALHHGVDIERDRGELGRRRLRHSPSRRRQHPDLRGVGAIAEVGQVEAEREPFAWTHRPQRLVRNQLEPLNLGDLEENRHLDRRGSRGAESYGRDHGRSRPGRRGHRHREEQRPAPRGAGWNLPALAPQDGDVSPLEHLVADGPIERQRLGNRHGDDLEGARQPGDDHGGRVHRFPDRADATLGDPGGGPPVARVAASAAGAAHSPALGGEIGRRAVDGTQDQDRPDEMAARHGATAASA